MSNLKRNYNRFMVKNRNKGIPNLMLWICIGNAIVFVFDFLFGLPVVDLLRFDSYKIMHGQVWRLFSYVFTFASESSFFSLRLLGAIISIMFYYWIGKVLDSVMGTFKFNLYYLTGILLSDLYALAIYWIFKVPMDMMVSVHILNTSMFLAVATLIPEQRVLLYGLIPLKMKWMAWVYMVLTAIDIIRPGVELASVWSTLNSLSRVFNVLIILFPLVALLNYFIFFGGSIRNLFTSKPRIRRQKVVKKQKEQPNPNWAGNYRNAAGEKPYHHKCMVCGRTDTDYPDLEFRYCSKCKGYCCYCIDHINNHEHVK